jgi:pyrroline-5-carboxylate reductase
MKYAFLGAGRMASAIIQGMLRANVCEPSEIVAACPEPDLLQSLRDATSIKIVSENTEAAAKAEVLILCVKPQDAAKALKQTGEALKNKLLVSIAAGLSLETLQKLAPGARLIRAMPNTAAIVGRSATAYAPGADTTPQDRELAESVFSSIGEVYPVEEKLLDAVTGLSGSGPAYVFLMIEALADGGVSCGLPRKLAQDLAIQTVLGAAELAKATSEHPAVLRDMVTSPGGTTAAALTELENRSVRAAFIEAVRAAERRSRELAGK